MSIICWIIGTPKSLRNWGSNILYVSQSTILEISSDKVFLLFKHTCSTIISIYTRLILLTRYCYKQCLVLETVKWTQQRVNFVCCLLTQRHITNVFYCVICQIEHAIKVKSPVTPKNPTSYLKNIYSFKELFLFCGRLCLLFNGGFSYFSLYIKSTLSPILYQHS